MEVVQIPDRMFFKIGEVADLLDVKSYVLRHWETEFPFLSPQKGGNGQRVYRRSDVEALMLIKHLLYNERYSVEGARKRINELRKKGKYIEFKKEKVLGGSENIEKTATLQSLSKELRELELQVKKPMSDFFKF